MTQVGPQYFADYELRLSVEMERGTRSGSSASCIAVLNHLLP